MSRDYRCYKLESITLGQDSKLASMGYYRAIDARTNTVK